MTLLLWSWVMQVNKMEELEDIKKWASTYLSKTSPARSTWLMDSITDIEAKLKNEYVKIPPGKVGEKYTTGSDYFTIERICFSDRNKTLVYKSQAGYLYEPSECKPYFAPDTIEKVIQDVDRLGLDPEKVVGVQELLLRTQKLTKESCGCSND